MSKAQQILKILSSNYHNHDVDWEAVLRINYSCLLESGANILDVGGNHGSHTMCFINDIRARNLWVFEPIPQLHAQLEAKFGRENGVSILPYALSDQDGQSTFQHKVNAEGESGLKIKSVYADGKTDNLSQITVDIRRLDSLNIPFLPDYIKIDIEGGEIDMLAGAISTINRSRPIISAEYGLFGYEAFCHSVVDLWTMATKIEYFVYDLFGNPFADAADFVSCVNKYYWDFLLVPKEKVMPLQARFDILKRLTLPIPLVKWRNTHLDIVNRPHSVG